MKVRASRVKACFCNSMQPKLHRKKTFFMKTIKHLFYLAASLMLLVNTSSDVYAYGNDWFGDKYRFYAYYDGMGSVNFSLLVWTEGATRNHYAYNETADKYKADTYHTYIEYSIDGKKSDDKTKTWTKLFYYEGDNVQNKKEKGMALFWAADPKKDYLFFTIPEDTELEKPLKGTKDTKDTVLISHARDDRRSVSLNLRWAVPTDMDEQKLSIRLHVYDRTDVGSIWTEHTFVLLDNVLMEPGNPAPELLMSSIFMGGTDPKDAGKIMVSYVFYDQPIEYTIFYNDSQHGSKQSITESVGSFDIPATDSVKKNLYISALVKRLNEVEVSVQSNSVDIPAYHVIRDFTVTAMMDTLKGENNAKIPMNSGYKLLKWSIRNPSAEDAASMDYYEIQRAYKSDFSDAEQIGTVLFSSHKNGKYEYVDRTSINNPNGKDSIYYRIRRMSSSSYGWTGHPYAASYTYVGRVKQIGMDLYDERHPHTPYAAFRDCATDSAINNNKIDLSGQLIWPIGDSTVTTAWDPNTKIEVVLWEDGSEAFVKTIDKLYTKVYGTMVIIEFEYEAQLPKTCQEYDLSVRLNTDATRFDKPQTTEVWFYPKLRTKAVNMTKVTASDSDESHPEHTLIKWETDGEPSYFTVWRSNEQGTFDSIAICDSQTRSYNDPEGKPSQEYTYKVKAVTLCSGDNMEKEATDLGTRSRYGYIDGNITYTNGDKMANIMVCLIQDDAAIDTVKTNADGTYKFSHIEYALNDNGSKYEIRIPNMGQNFYPAKGGSGPAQVLLTPSSPAVHNVNFLSDDYRRCSGRVLYTGTTIPVRDAYFLINGQVAKSSGDTIRTDASGNFVLSVPSGIDFTLTVAKKKHTFVDNGKLILYGTDTLNVSKGSLDAVRFWDNTRVRLVGRLAGGDIQGLKPLGFGLSKNNLGDSLKLVFELEGDNIAHFVYDEKNLSKNTRDTTFVCANGKDTTLRTPVRFEEKRIIVRPDVKTGEYVIDLPPVKYRIVEATANGYATLFGAGRTSETKDLTFSLDTVRVSHENKPVWYHDTYSVIYHAPASVVVTQLRFGVPLEHYGEEVVEGYTLDSIRYDSVCTHKSGKWEYTLGYPVYMSDYRYGFRINAREEYHYNNDRNRNLDIVPLGNHKFTVYNGLESGTSIIKGELDSEGRSDVIVNVSNMSFDAIGTDEALKRFEVSVSINGQDVHAQPIKAFVLGNRLTGNNVIQKVGSTVTLNDVLRDPPGSNSSAWISKGATYSTSYSLSKTINASLSGSVDVKRKLNQSIGSYSGAGAGTFTGTWFENSSGINVPIASFTYTGTRTSTYSYSFTTNERITTSPENTVLGIGAPATVFIGHTVNTYATHAETFNVVDTATLKAMTPAIEQGVAHVVKYEKGASHALIVAQDLAFTMDEVPVQFAYTQNHIVNQIIPQLFSELASIIYSDSTAAQRKADATDKVSYWLKPDSTILTIKPKKWEKDKTPHIYTDEVKEYKQLIDQWTKILVNNEYIELYGSNTANRLGSYSLSGGTSFSYTEVGSTSASYSNADNEAPSSDIAALLTGAFFTWFANDLTDTYKLVDEFIKKKKDKDNNDADNRGKDITIDGAKAWKVNILPSISGTWDHTSSTSPSFNREIGFSLSQNGVGYVDVDVYRLNSTVDFNNDSTLKSWRTLAANLPVAKDSMKTGNYDCSDFVYLLRGGATSCPYIGENVTHFYRPGTVLDPATVKLESPHIEVDRHEVSGVAADGVAVFDLQIWNETEVPAGVMDGVHSFNLRLDEPSNPNGAKVTIDGNPLTPSGMDFLLTGRQIIHKKLEVRQGATALNYDSLELVLMSSCDPLNKCHQYISVHFLPSSTPVRIATPDDQWVMNTNSPYDKQGYYLPVVIDGFDPDYNNFDHIELQYKLSTQSESNWVTLCSYYVDEKYYNKASGNKQMFKKEAGRIDNIHFYGERDPMEQRYDLRAVSYCRYGTGYVTMASEPVSGIKDTRRPELFGKVSPTNGVLTQQDYISVPFSEPIAYNYLDEDNNFQVVGFKNKADYFSMPTLDFSGSDSYARTQTARDLSHGDFSIDLMVYKENPNGYLAFFSTGQPAAEQKQTIEFGYTGKQLYARICDTQILSDTIDLPHNFTRVIMTYSAKEGNVRLYVGTQQVGSGKAQMSAFAAAPLTFGVDMNNINPFKGRMVEARIWSKALTLGEITSTNNICLTGYESGLLAYYPMTEGYGKTASDKAHGANADLHNLTWSMPEGLAIRTSGEGVELDAQWFNNTADADYTLLFNFRSNPSSSFNGDVLLFGDVNAKMDTTNKQIGIFMKSSGQIELVSGSTNRLIADGNYNDGAWHTLGLVVSHRFNYTHLYIDTKLKAHADGQFFGVWAMSKTYLGKNFDGYFDELSMWELAMPQSYLNEFYFRSPNGQELGLRCYVPFDQRIKNTANIYETHYSQYNAKLYFNNEKQEWYAKQDTVVLSNLDDQSTTKDVCPLIRNSEYENMFFSWTSRDNDLVINLKMPDAEINHKTIFFSLRDVEDLQGNRLLNPIAWSVYLDRNVIRWTEQNLWVEKSAGTMDTVVYTKITNYSGEAKSFIISGLPDWLTVDEPIGTLQPQEERVLAFTISGDLNAGDYVVPISVTDETDLTDMILFNVRVNAVFPNWSVPNGYNLNMNLVGTVHLQDEAHGTYVDTDTRDVVGAFYGNTCIGMQSITSNVGSTANLYLKIYGNDNMKKENISLRLWQASTGKTFVLQPDKNASVIRFVPDTIYGSVKQPVQLHVANLRVQNIPVNLGWNWISFYVKPENLNSSFITTGGFSPDDQIKTYYGNNSSMIASSEPDIAVYTQNKWSKNMNLFNSNIYMLHVSRNMVLEVRGEAADKVPTLTIRHGWNNLPCLFEANTPLAAAMTDYFNAAKDGDIITGYYQFAIFDNKRWVGSLETLIPGEGYMLYRQDAKDVTVHFYPSAPATAPRKSTLVESESMNHSHSTAMPIVAALESNEVAIHSDNAVLRAYAHDELVGEAQAVDGMWFLLVHAADGSELTFTVTDDKGEEQPASNILNYGAFAPTGTVHNPYLIRFGDSDLRKVIENGILYIHRNGNVYDAQGALVK